MDEKRNDCPADYALSLINRKWKLLIMWHLSKEKSIRFNELKRKLNGISNLMLSKSLKELEEDKLVNRVQYNTIPPRVEYSLTDLGYSLEKIIMMLGEWGEMVKKEQIEDYQR